MCKFVLKPMDARQENNFTGYDPTGPKQIKSKAVAVSVRDSLAVRGPPLP